MDEWMDGWMLVVGCSGLMKMMMIMMMDGKILEEVYMFIIVWLGFFLMGIDCWFG